MPSCRAPSAPARWTSSAPVGRSPTAATLLRSKAARRDLIAGARQRYNLVFVNAAPLLDHPEGASFASQSDGVILFVSAGTEVADLQVVRDRLDVVRTPLLGVVYDRSGG